MGELDALVLPLVDVYQFWKTLNFSVVFTGHCLFCASLAPQFKDKYLVHYLVCVLGPILKDLQTQPLTHNDHLI
jgi:hypothetical protein